MSFSVFWPGMVFALTCSVMLPGFRLRCPGVLSAQFFLHQEISMNNKFLPVVASLPVLLLSFDASATTLITETMQTSITTAFGDLKDTVSTLVTTAIPFVIGVGLLLALPHLIRRVLQFIVR
jgi:hypothetical protein